MGGGRAASAARAPGGRAREGTPPPPPLPPPPPPAAAARGPARPAGSAGALPLPPHSPPPCPRPVGGPVDWLRHGEPPQRTCSCFFRGVGSEREMQCLRITRLGERVPAERGVAHTKNFPSLPPAGVRLPRAPRTHARTGARPPPPPVCIHNPTLPQTTGSPAHCGARHRSKSLPPPRRRAIRRRRVTEPPRPSRHRAHRASHHGADVG